MTKTTPYTQLYIFSKTAKKINSVPKLLDVITHGSGRKK